MSSKSVSGRPALLKKINRNLILELLFKQKQISRAEISKVTGLALPSVMRLVDGLIKDGLIVDIGKGMSSGGRKPNLLALNDGYMYIIGVEIAVKTTIILTDFTGTIVDEWSSEEMVNSTPATILDQVLVHINRIIEKHQLSKALIGGIGIGTPGTNFKFEREIPYSILKGWESMDVKGWFESRIDYPVFIENVARTRTLAELWFGHGKTYDDFIYVFVDQGVGCGIVSNNDIYKGHHHVAGEFGHHIIEMNGKPCYCGSHGCIEMYVSVGAIINQFQDRGFEVTTFSELLNLSDQDILSQTGEILGVGIANLINIHNPKAVIIGGIVSTCDVIVSSAKKRIQKSIFSNYALETPIHQGMVETEGIGSVALVIHQILDNLDQS